MLAPAPILLFLYLGEQSRFFARWMLPIYPILAILAAWSIVALVSRFRFRVLLPVAAALALAQGLVFSVHNDLVLAQDDTRQIARDWMVENIPGATKIVVEPIAPDQWAADIGRPLFEFTDNGNRWFKFPTSRSCFFNGQNRYRPPCPTVKLEDYERAATRPDRIDVYEQRGYCWVVTGSNQSGRAYADPDVVPDAIRYYDELRRRGDVAFRVSPYGGDSQRVPFSFDYSFNYYPLTYERPGPEVVIYRLRDGECADVVPGRQGVSAEAPAIRHSADTPPSASGRCATRHRTHPLSAGAEISPVSRDGRSVRSTAPRPATLHAMRRVLAFLIGFGFVALAIPNLIVWAGGRAPVTTDTREVPHAQAALVLGAQVMPNGAPSSMLSDRIDRGRRAVRVGPRRQAPALRRPQPLGVRRGRHDARILLKRGIPAEDIFTDHAGFDTWDSAQRARRVFDVESAVVVTQRFHMARALFDARRAGLRVTGYAADRRDYGRVMPRLRVREAAARVKALGDTITGADPHFLGDKIPITGAPTTGCSMNM